MLHIEFLYVKMQQCTPADSMCSYKNMKLFSTKANLSSYKAIREFYALEILKLKFFQYKLLQNYCQEYRSYTNKNVALTSYFHQVKLYRVHFF